MGIGDNDLLKAVLAFVGGGVINTAVLGWLFFRMVSIDRQVAELKVHLRYMAKELAYANGREWTEENEDGIK